MKSQMIGKKIALDFTASSAGNGLRWEIPFHLLDAFFYAAEGRMSVPFQDSREAVSILDTIKAAIDRGCEQR